MSFNGNYTFPVRWAKSPDMEKAVLVSHVEYTEDGKVNLVVRQQPRPIPAAVEAAYLSASEYRVFGDLLNRAGYSPLRLSQREQAEQLSMSPATILKARRKLETLGFLVIVPDAAGELLIIPEELETLQGVNDGG